MPDISLLTEIAAFYDVNIPELIYGERKSEKMEEEEKRNCRNHVGLCKSRKREAGKEHPEYEHYWAHSIVRLYDTWGNRRL